MPHGAVAEAEQVPYGGAGAAVLVGVDDGVAVAGVGVDHHHLDVRRRWTVAASRRCTSMMTITASTASSSRRENAPRTSSWVGTATGSRVTA